MSLTQVKALYDFATEVAGELCFSVNDVLILTNENVGDGWWEAKNSYGQIGLVPQSYFEVIGEKGQKRLPVSDLVPPRLAPRPGASNGLHNSLSLPVRPVQQVLCEVHRSFQSPSPVDERQTTIAAMSTSGGRPVPPPEGCSATLSESQLVPLPGLSAVPIPLPGLCAVPKRDGRPIPPIKPPGLSTRTLTASPVNGDDTKDTEPQQETKVVSLVPVARPIPPIKPPGLFARLSAMGEVVSDVEYLVDDTENDGEDEDVNDAATTGDDVKINEEWEDECDEDDDDFYEEDIANDSEEDSLDHVLKTNTATESEDDRDDVIEVPAETTDDQLKQSTADNSPKKQQHTRITHFTMGGGDAYLFDMKLPGVPDAVLRTFISETSDGSPCWMARVEPYTCSILSPKKATKFRGMKSFIVYQIKSSFCNGHVSRRYKQFNWLHRRLIDKFTSIAIPPLPEKQIAGRFEDDFINIRLRQLQLWIDRMCRHPVIAKSDVYLHFLTCTNAKEWKLGKRIAEKDKYQGGLFFQTVVAPSKPLDARFVEMKMENFGRFIRSLDDSIRHLYNTGENNAKVHEDSFGKEYQKLGRSILALSKSFENDDRTAANPITNAVANTGRTVDDIGQLFAKQPQRDICHLMEGLNVYRGLLSVLPDILLVHRSSTNKIQENAGMMTEAEIEAVESRADVITYTVLAEMNHFEEHRVIDFRNYMQHYLQEQITFYRQITQRLQDALQQFDNVH